MTAMQMGLVEPEDVPRLTVDGAPNTHPDPAAYAAALTGDGYGWLNTLAGAAQETPETCPSCRTPMVLPDWAPVLWTCPVCHPAEATGEVSAR